MDNEMSSRKDTCIKKVSRKKSGLVKILTLTALSLIILSNNGFNISSKVYAASTPNNLPSFGIGISAEPDKTGLDGWMPGTNVPWSYAYQYLTGGVNTGNGWETWSTNGTFPLDYANKASQHNYIPVLTYYEIHQSSGFCDGCGESQKDLSNLNNPSTMNSYFSNYIFLMKRLGNDNYQGVQGFGKTAIVHIEPDLSGFAMQAVLNNGNCYGYCTAQGNSPDYLKASVSSSGISEVSSFPNTYAGFNLALLHIRDLYAPNVLLATHVSLWQGGTDIGSSSDPNLDITNLANNVATFTSKAGADSSSTSSYDLIFNDVLDRDAGYYKYVYGNSSYWWDKNNVNLPNFHRWEDYISTISKATGKPFMIWQIPEGNQYFDTENNTNGHYQDNRAEYFFSHISELQQSGIIGLLFGAGNQGSTNNFDAINDGITNPSSFCTSDGLSSGQVCNNNTSIYPDDDGGYIRIQASKFYSNNNQSLAPITISPPANSAPAPSLNLNTSIQTTAGVKPSFNVLPAVVTSNKINSPVNVSSNIQNNTSSVQNNILVDFEVYDSSSKKVYQQFFNNQSFKTNETKQYIINWTAPSVGNYSLDVGVFSNDWSNCYTWNTNSINVISSNTNYNQSINLWWPTNNATISGVQPFQARIDNMDLNSYNIYWQVDSGQVNLMSNNLQEGVKESYVDVSPWNWRWNGPYKLTFTAKDLNNNIIAQTTIGITVTHY